MNIFPQLNNNKISVLLSTLILCIILIKYEYNNNAIAVVIVMALGYAP